MIREFFQYRTDWLEETKFDSIKIPNQALEKIIAMGEDVLPLILFDLAQSTNVKQPIRWFYALSQITRKMPVRDEDLGDIMYMAMDWLEWASQNGFQNYIKLT
ncbi:MAG: hypothetical protein ACC656_00260 [Candidatus Heimdallarchaeota archaeon]